MNNAYLNLPQTSPTYNTYACRLLETLYQPNPERLFRGLGYPLDGNENLTYQAVSASRTPTMYADCQTLDCLWIEGTDGNYSQIESFVAGFSRPIVDLSSWGASLWFETAALDLLTSFPALRNENRVLFVWAHSLGGGTAAALMAKLRALVPYKRMFVSTYGSPRPGSQVLQATLAREPNLYRFYNDADPVRWVPPHTTELAWIAAIVPVAIAQGADSQVQVGNPWQVNEDGTIVNLAGEPNATSAVAYSIAGWCSSPQGFGNAVHNITEYKNRFANQFANENVPLPAVPKPAMAQPVNISAAAMRQIRDRGVSEMETAVANNTAPPTVVSVQGSTTSPPPRYKRKKVGTVWTVQFEGEVVAIGPGKRHAGTIKRRLNRALSASQRN